MGRSPIFAGILLSLSLACTPTGEREDQEGDAAPGAEVASDVGGTHALSQGGAASYPSALAELDHRIAVSAARAEAQRGGWLPHVEVAQLHQSRARLTGDYADYARAEEALTRAFEVPGCAAYAARARLNLTLHRVDRAAADLAALGAIGKPDTHREAALAGLQGERAFQVGDYAGALERYEASHRLRPLPESAARLGVYRWKTGDFDNAEAAFGEAEALAKGGDPLFQSWLHLQRGLMDLDRGRYGDALADYTQADGALPGWWLIEEHIAEIYTLTGREAEALEAYAALIEDTGNPEFIDAAAEIYLARGDDAAARALIHRASGLFAERLAAFPEATRGHAFDHALAFEASGQMALEMAEADAALRPSAPTFIHLAQARLKVGDAEGARGAIDQALASPWRSADLFEVAAEVYGALGDAPRAAELEAEALAIRPRG